MNRILTRLSLVILELDSHQGSNKYVLQLNRHLNGYSFFGGHIEESESPREAALRELKEETGCQELKSRWGIELSGEVRDSEWKKVHESLQAVNGPHDNASRLPFFSLRARRENKEPEKVAHVHFFRLVADRAQFPTLYEQLVTLSRSAVGTEEDFIEANLCKLFTAEQLVREAWENQDNPFLRFALKKGVLRIPHDSLLTAPYILHPSALETFLQDRLEHLFDNALNLSVGESLDVAMLCPGQDEIRLCMQANQTLRAGLELRWTGSNEVVRLCFPYPAAGVFILRSETSKDGRAGKWVWHPRLVGIPGLWLIRKHSFVKGARSATDYVRLVLADGRHLDYELNQPNQSLRIFFSFMMPSVLGNESVGNCPGISEIEKRFSAGFVKVSKKNREKLSEALSEAFSRIAQESNLSEIERMDGQDVTWQRLYTYSVYLVTRILESLAGKLRKPRREISPLDVWTALCNISLDLVPVSDLMKTGWLHYFSPLNGIDALSRLMSFQRYDYKKETIESLPAVFRQNHPSFRGIICPVESPESPKVGITLHLARGVRTDVIGRLYASKETSDDRDLGYAASLVPFYQHNDGPRSMMGAKNLKQAAPVKGRSSPAVCTGHEKTIEAIVRPLVDAGIAETCSCGAPGVDLLVAYMPWYGWNMEDAIVANKRLVNEGVLDWETEETHLEYILPGYELTTPVFENTFEEAFKVLRYDEKGLHKPGWTTPESAVAFFKDLKTGQGLPVKCGGDDPGELIAIEYVQPPSPHLGGSLFWKVRRRLPLMVGDKLMGRHGNKGVVSAILPPDELPRLPEDTRLPKELQGRAVDLILNPHGVISRMNLGQLVETSVGLSHRLGTPSLRLPIDVGRAFSKVDLNLLRDSLLSVNGEGAARLIDEYGRMYLNLPNGKKTKSPVIVGFQYIVRLKHVASGKAQVRGGASLRSPYPYNPVTGQPVGGRRRKGGQRLGEMEMWALAAHQADENLRSVLGLKSDPAHHCKGLRHGQTFQAIRDHLFALGVEIREDHEKGAELGWASRERIQQCGKEVTGVSTWTLGVEGEFYCAKEGCRYRYPRRVLATGKPERGQDFQLTVRDVLTEHGLRFPDSVAETIPPLSNREQLEGEIEITLEPVGSNGKKRRIKFQYTRRKRTLHVSFKLGRSSFAAYKQDDPGKQKEVALEKIADLWITCPRHRTVRLVSRGQRLVSVGVEGGLCDPALFGDVNVSNWHADTWGYIRLPEPIAYPGKLPYGQSKLLFGEQDKPPALQAIPVLPLKYRYRGLRRVGSAILPEKDQLTNKYKRLAELVEQGAGKERIRGAVAGLFMMIYDRLFGKDGLIRHDGLGRRVDMSGRLVIVPDPTLDWDACGVPTEILMVLLGPRIAKCPEILSEFVQDKAVDRLIEAIFGLKWHLPDVTKETEQFVLSEDFWSGIVWPSKELAAGHLRLAQRVIKRYLEEYPSTTVLLNRQPSLHRYSIMGFRPVPLSHQEGLVLKIDPLVCKGFGADFDGDEMTLHMPIGKKDQVEAEDIKPTKRWNILSLANHQPLANFDQDFVSGHFLISIDDQARGKLKTILAAMRCRECIAFVEKPGPWDKNHGEALLRHLCIKHPDEVPAIVPEWMQLAFEAATEHGLSFGFLELVHIRENFTELTTGVLRDMNGITNAERLSRATSTLGEEVLRGLNNIVSLPGDQPGCGFAALAVSGARGTKQTRQLVSARGYLDPGDAGFESVPSDFFVKESLVGGMTPESSFMAAMNSRSSMIDKKLVTRRAGHLTRQLVLAGWGWVVKSGDCGIARESDRLLASCRWREKKTICTSCYGAIPGYNEVPDGYPAGLIAAQSVGERGTQLSMQSFHTAERQMSIDDVDSLLKGKDPAPGSGDREPGYNWFRVESDAKEFVKRMHREKGYTNIDERHLLLIWLIIHMSEKKTLTSAWENNRSGLSALIGPGQWKAMLAAIRDGWQDDFSSPFTRVMTGQSPGDA